MATAAVQPFESEVFRSRFYDPRGVDRSYVRALGDGLYRRFEVNRAGATVREVDVEAAAVDPRVRRYADERAGLVPSLVAEDDDDDDCDD